MNILLLGGTEFVGRHITQMAIDRGHNICLFNRCNNIDIFPDVLRYCGDRNSFGEATSGHNIDDSIKIIRPIDCVIDVSGYYRHHVKSILDYVESDYYIFISTINVTLPDSDYAYGKIGCEIEIMNRVKNFLIFRPKELCGEYDNTDRFDYSKWPDVYYKGDDIPISYIDIELFALTVISHMENKTVGIIQ